MVEMGRQFDDNKILRRAIEQYRFLRKEYPGSKYRFDALFTIGEIYKDDLEDPEEALATFQEFLHRYPRNRLAEQAKAAVADLKQDHGDSYKSAAQREAEKFQKAADLAKSTKAENKLSDKSGEDQETNDEESSASSSDETSEVSSRHQHPPLVDSGLHPGCD